MLSVKCKFLQDNSRALLMFDKSGMPVLVIATEKGHAEIVELLLAQTGIDVNIPDKV